MSIAARVLRPCRKCWAATALLLALAASGAQAACSRTIIVPVAPTGFSVIVKDEQQVSGAVPDWLRQAGAAQGCSFAFPVYPRARLTMMFFDTGEADIFVPATRTAARDRRSLFVPLIQFTPNLVTLIKLQASAPGHLNELKARKDWRAVTVRSYSWGDEYDALLQLLEQEKRITFVADLRTVVTMLKAGRAEFSILPPTLVHASLSEEDRQVLAYSPLPGMPRIDSGAYLSLSRLSSADRERLQHLLSRGAQDGSLQRSYEKYYPPEILLRDLGHR